MNVAELGQTTTEPVTEVLDSSESPGPLNQPLPQPKEFSSTYTRLEQLESEEKKLREQSEINSNRIRAETVSEAIAVVSEQLHFKSMEELKELCVIAELQHHLKEGDDITQFVKRLVADHKGGDSF